MPAMLARFEHADRAADPIELRRHVLASSCFQDDRYDHQWLFVENQQNRAYSSISKLYVDARKRSRHELICFMHQDVFLPPDWDS